MAATFFEAKPKRLKTWSDETRREHAIKLEEGVPVRIHGTNGGYLFSLFATPDGVVYRYNDKRWGDRRKIPARRITWEQPI